MERILFLITVSISFILFIYKRKIFDFLSLAYFSSLVYFMPLLFGFVTIRVNDRTIYNTIDPKLYIISIVLLYSITIVAFIFDRNKDVNMVNIKQDRMFSVVCSILFLLISVIFYIVQGYKMIGSMRNLEDMVGIYKIWSNFILILGIVSLVNRYKLGYVISIIGSGIDLYMGDRTISVILAVSSITYLLMTSTQNRRIIYKKVLIILLILISPFIMYKKIIGPIQRNDFNELMNRLTTPTTYTSAITNLEPFTTQSILNEVIAREYKVADNTLSSIVNLNPLSKNKIEVKSFNDQFQNSLFKDVKYGMGSNIWAEILSNYSYLVLIMAILIYTYISYISNRLARKEMNIHYLTLVYICVPYFIFYIHRNSLVYQINLILRVIYLYVFTIILYSIISKVRFIKKY